jgi:hypothetical protein
MSIFGLFWSVLATFATPENVSLEDISAVRAVQIRCDSCVSALAANIG